MKGMIFSSIMFGGLMHAMPDVKTVDESGLLGALGNPQGASLITQIAQDRKKYERKAALKTWQQEFAKSKATIGFERFFDLPYTLQIKIVHSSDLKNCYALRYKRELAPFMVRNGCNARDIIKTVDYHINTVKQIVNAAIKKKLVESQKLVALSGFDNYLSHIITGSTSYLVSPWDKVCVYGYSDRTYEIVFHEERFRLFINSCSFDQLLFLISLAQTISLPEGTMIRLSPQQHAIYQTFDMIMRRFISNRYPWIDFYFPIIETPFGLDEQIEQMQNNVGARIYSWAYSLASKMRLL